jgi:hypothetical protein
MVSLDFLANEKEVLVYVVVWVALLFYVRTDVLWRVSSSALAFQVV